MTPAIYSTFSDCVYEWKADWDKDGSMAGVTPFGWESSAQTDFEQINSVFNSIDMTEVLEIQHGCNGICEQGLFAVSGVVGDGVPDLICAEVVSASFADNG